MKHSPKICVVCGREFQWRKKWRYNWEPEAGSEEARLYEHFLKARDWVD